MQWNEVETIFEVDGALRDIYVPHTSLTDWDKLIDLSMKYGRVSYTRDGEDAALPSSVAELLDDQEHSHCMRVDLGGPVANGHFFSADEIEMDLDPREIKSQAALDAVLEFFGKLGQEINRDVSITSESSPDDVLLCYSVKEQTWQLPKQS